MTIAVSMGSRQTKRLPVRRRLADGWWLSIGLYAALGLTLLAPMVVALLWSLVDPKAGWFAPDILPRGLSLIHWQA